MFAASGAVKAQTADNVVLRWNQATLEAIQITRMPPPVAARALAIVHTCIFDSWAAYDDVATGTQFGPRLRRPNSERIIANKEKAVSFAAYLALVDLFPSQRVTEFDPLMTNLGFDPSDPSNDVSKPDGIAKIACQAVLNSRHADGSNQLGDMSPGAYADYTGYSPRNTAQFLTDPNRWQPLLINGVPQRWQLPQWGLVKPFALQAGSEYRTAVLSDGPFRYPSDGYWKQGLDVIEINSHLGDREKVIAEYWADGAGTFTPPGHWNIFAEEISRRDRHTLDEDVKLFFILGNALMDSGIAAWDAKRFTDSIRPISVIRAMGSMRAMAWAGPGLGVRMIDCRDFRSYLPTPAFPSYVSGHSAFSSAAAEVLKRFTGSDRFFASFTAPPGSSLIEPGLTPMLPTILSWTTFSEAADQAGLSRRYGGIHFEADDLAGRKLGRFVADKVWLKAERYIQGVG